MVAGVFAVGVWVSHRVPSVRRPKFRAWFQGSLAVLMVLASLAVLPRAYTLPKTGFRGALAYVETRRGAKEAIAAVGSAVRPYQYYGADFCEVASIDELDRVLANNEAVYVLHTIPLSLESKAPRLASRLAEAAEVARFPGSLGGGDVVVLRIAGTSPERR